MARVLRYFKLENGWLAPTLLLVLVLLPVFSLNDAQWIDRTQDLLPVMLLGAVLGVVAGKARLNRIVAVPLGLLPGAAVFYIWFGEIIPPLRLITNRLAALPAWVSDYWNGIVRGENPLLPVVREIQARNDLMAGRLWDWVVVGTEGGYSSDNFVFFFLLALLMLAVSFFTAWFIYRDRNALIAVMPVGLTLVINSFLSNRGMAWIIAYVIVTLILMMAANLAAMQHVWQKKDIDYSAELNFDLGAFAIQVSLVLALAALAMPTLRSNPVASTWWIYASRPWGEVETLVNRMFSGINNPNPDIGTGSKGALVLGGSFDRSEASPVYMYVTTNEYILSPSDAEMLGELDAGPPQHYWRGETWDYYTGRGWDHSLKVAVDRSAEQPTTSFSIPGAVTIVQNIQILAPRADILFAANQPQAVAQPYRVMSLGDDDFSTLYLRRVPLTAVTYQVTSTLPTLGETDLRRSAPVYPEWVQTYYLQLPKSLPARVTDLAEELTAGATTAYDKVLAIQEYLRKLPYDPKIKLPSTGNYDAVDWFLFTQKGYCDYFGTVLAVMLRSVGVPARLATGYLTGFYDYGLSRYEVSENDGHAWTEVYFPEYGWIEFEPTPARAAFSRPPGSLLTNEPFILPPMTVQTKESTWLDSLRVRFDLSALRFVPLIVAVVLAAVLLWSLWPLLERRLATSAFIVKIYGRMCRYAAWAGLARPLAATPYEYARVLAEPVSKAAPGPLQWRHRPPPAGETGPAEHIAAISSAFVQTRYSQHAPDAETRQRVVASWQAVKGHIWSLVTRNSLRRLLRR